MREFADEPERQIIGVVGDVRDDSGLNNDPRPTMYIPQAQVPDAANALNVGITPMAWVVRTRVAPASLRGRDPGAAASGRPACRSRTSADDRRGVAIDVSRQRFNMLLMTVFAASALLLAAIGIYGLMAYSVEQRTQEIGIRLALGAESARDVRRMILFQGMQLAVARRPHRRAVGARVDPVHHHHPLSACRRAGSGMVFVGIPVALAVVALVAVWLPALRASRVDPLTALRCE